MTKKKTPEELAMAFSAESRQRKLIHQLEVKKWGIEQTAEKAAEYGIELPQPDDLRLAEIAEYYGL